MTREGKLLYGATLLIECLAILPRFLVGFVGAYVVVPFFLFPFILVRSIGALMTGGELPIFGFLQVFLGLDVLIGLVVAFGPPLWSLLTLLALPGGNRLTRFALGAREMSRREFMMYRNAYEEVEREAPAGTIVPQEVYVLDELLPNAYVVGTTLYLTRELLRSDHLAPVLAHELGHLNPSVGGETTDGRLTLALRRLVLPPLYLLSGNLRPLNPLVQGAETPGRQLGCLIGVFFTIVSFVVSLAGGGFGLWLLNPPWVWFWRGREYAADWFAHRCGQGPGLIEYLEQHQFFDVSVPYFLAEHPYTELRIDRLQGLVEGVDREAATGSDGNTGPVPPNRFGR